MATSALSTGGLIDPTKQAEYPVVLGDRLARNNGDQSRLVNIQYNYKTKSATANRSKITRSLQSQDLYNLTISDKAPSKEQNDLTYSYKGSADPAQSDSDQNLVLVFDPDRKAFVLESIATQLNFNLRSAPAKTEKQVLEQYAQLRTLHNDEQGSGDEASDNGMDNEPADESNPYDFRHFLPKENADDEKSVSDHASDTHSITSKAEAPVMPATKPVPTSKPRSKPQTNPLRQKKTVREPVKDAKAQAKPKSKPEPKPESTPAASIEKEEFEEPRPSPSDTGSAAVSSQKTVPSPGSNIIIDGDLIIDMGSPPPSRPFSINPAHFSSNHTPANYAEDDEDEEMEDFRLPSPARTGHTAQPKQKESAPVPASDGEEAEDDDPLAAEMEAAFEESAREEEKASTYPYSSQQYNVASDDESEVSEEE